ncbi:MAG TPA: hypothetical protein VGD14_19365 [bacterium]
MTEKQFLNNLAGGKGDVIQQFLDLLDRLKISYCVIGGLAVNAYVEPVVSLDLDLVVAADSIEKLKKAAAETFSIKEFPHSLNLSSSESQLRIQIQTDSRYQKFLDSASSKTILGYEMKAAALEDLLQGKIWAYLDPERRRSKRQKDLTDIFRLVESYQHLFALLPKEIKSQW